jgi:hypothetical protein
MAPVLLPFRIRLRRRLAAITRWLGKAPKILAENRPQVRLQRMCPFCGLITLRQKSSCLECGKSLKPA